MIFPERVKSVLPSDKVLEIGPGGTPHSRSDVFLELIYTDDMEFSVQRGKTPPLVTDKRVVYYDGLKFPFRDREFDYVICSHVIEHVPDPPSFLAEMFRVALRGYIEYPTILYEYLYNFQYHVNFVKCINGKLIYMKKNDTLLKEFSPVHAFFFESLEKGYFCLVDDLREFMFEGFEWKEPFSFAKAGSVSELVSAPDSIMEKPKCVRGPEFDLTTIQLLKLIIRRIPITSVLIDKIKRRPMDGKG